jgi:uncharacterized protein
MTEFVPLWSAQPSGSLWRNAGGWTLVILGVAGLMLPVLPGIPLLIMGLVLLSADYRWARTCLRRVKLWTRKLKRHRSRLADAHPIMQRQNEKLDLRMESGHNNNPTMSPKESMTMKPTHVETELYPTTPITDPSYDHQIKVRAYELFEQRGREHGHDLDDWLQAEVELAMPARSQLTAVAA